MTHDSRVELRVSASLLRRLRAVLSSPPDGVRETLADVLRRAVLRETKRLEAARERACEAKGI